MPTTLPLPTHTTESQLDRAVKVLDAAHPRLAAASADELISLAEICIYGTMQAAYEWVAVSSRFKGLPEKSPLRAEDVMTGPVATVRHLRLLIQSLRDIKAYGKPRLPGHPWMGSDARLRVPVFPAQGLYDGLTFQGFKVESRMLPGITAETLKQCAQGVPGRWKPDNPRIALVLGAGNVSSIPTTDAFTKLFQEGRSVLLKMNPVNESLGPVFERAYAAADRRRLSADYLRRLGRRRGGHPARPGRRGAHHRLDQLARRHRLGGARSGSRSPQTRQRSRAQKTHLQRTGQRHSVDRRAGQIHGTAARFSGSKYRHVDHQQLLVQLHCHQGHPHVGQLARPRAVPRQDSARVLDSITTRKAYYPGALDRFVRFANRTGDGDKLPWTLLRGMGPQASPQFFKEESFVCVSVETPLSADSDTAFLNQAVDFANRELWGTLAASITLPADFRKDPNARSRRCKRP